MNLIGVPTKTVFHQYLQPLADMGFLYVLDAQKAGVLTDEETKFLMAMTGGVVLNEQQFDELTHKRFSQLTATF